MTVSKPYLGQTSSDQDTKIVGRSTKDVREEKSASWHDLFLIDLQRFLKESVDSS